MSEHIQTPTQFVESLIQDKCDPILGEKVRQHLQDLGLETLEGVYNPYQAFKALKDGIHTAYKSLGLDIDGDESIKDTPSRFAKMFVGELTKGLNYDFFPKCTATPNGKTTEEPLPSTRMIMTPEEFATGKTKVTTGSYDQLVLVKRIRTVSLCEHHLQTIDGFTHVAYIPGPRVLGLSKFARVAEFFAARPQIQERMTEQTYAALAFILETPDVAVIQTCVHFCMRARGAKQPESWTTTNKMGGRFLTNVALREELFHGIAN